MTGRIQPRQIARTVLLPGFIPRIRDCFRSPFSFLAGLFAVSFQNVRLLPASHAYVQPDAYGTFGILDVFRAASANLVYDRQHIDQIIMYFALLAGFITFALFVVTTLLYGAFMPAYAMPTDVGGLMASIYSYTETKRPEQDVALLLLDRTMGLRGDTPTGTFFGSAAAQMCPGMQLGASECTTLPAFPSPFHIAMQSLLGFYSWVIFCFAVLYFLYFCITIVIEIAMKGKPFGERFNTFWVPIRVVLALGMLLPLPPAGLNGAQYIILYTAKISSAFATNGWLYYNEFMTAAMQGKNPIGLSPYKWDPALGPTIVDSSPLAAKLTPPDTSELVRFAHIQASCEYYQERVNGYDGSDQTKNVRGYLVISGKDSIPAYEEPTASQVQDTQNYQFSFPTYDNAVQYFGYKNINIIFGVKDGLKYKEHPGNVLPLCGRLVIPVTSLDDPATGMPENPGAAIANKLYYNYTLTLFDKTTYLRQLMEGFASQMIENYAKMPGQNRCNWDKNNDKILEHPLSLSPLTQLGPCNDDPIATYMSYQIETYQTIFQTLINQANAEMAKIQNFQIDDQILNRGWAGAGIWYEKIASANGAYVSAVQQLPYGVEKPGIMAKLDKILGAINFGSLGGTKKCVLSTGGGRSLSADEEAYATAMCMINAYMMGETNSASFRPDPSGPVGVSGLNGYTIQRPNPGRENPVIAAIGQVFDSQFLYNVDDNRQTHPFTQLVTIGRVLIEKSSRNMLTGSAIAAGGGIVDVGNKDVGSSLKKLSSFYLTVASIFFTAGFMLYYVLPLLPFIYFFFAMFAWVQAIFEGLIGAPLWALAHVKLDGAGLPSGWSRRGYLMILEILVRPIVTVFALIAAMSIFAAASYAINEMMDFLAKSGDHSIVDITVQGRDPTNLLGMVDGFLRKVAYILIMYMLAMSCFKIIDQIPAQVMRWIGGSGGFAEMAKGGAGSGADKFVSNSFVAVGNPARGIIDKLDDHTSQAANALAEFSDSNTTDKPIARTVQQIFGKSRDDQINDALTTSTSEMLGERNANLKAAVKLEKEANAQGVPPVVKEQKLAEAKAKKKFARLFDPVFLSDPVNIDKIRDPEHRRIAEENIRKMREGLKIANPIMYDMMLGSEGVYVDPDNVSKQLTARLKAIRDKSLQEAMKS